MPESKSTTDIEAGKTSAGDKSAPSSTRSKTEIALGFGIVGLLLLVLGGVASIFIVVTNNQAACWRSNVDTAKKDAVAHEFIDGTDVAPEAFFSPEFKKTIKASFRAQRVALYEKCLDAKMNYVDPHTNFNKWDKILEYGTSFADKAPESTMLLFTPAKECAGEAIDPFLGVWYRRSDQMKRIIRSERIQQFEKCFEGKMTTFEGPNPWDEVAHFAETQALTNDDTSMHIFTPAMECAGEAVDAVLDVW